jgi:hypothetical protein
MLAPLTVLIFRIPKRINGSGCRSSQPTKPTRKPTETARNPIVLPASQPCWPACVIAYTSDDRPAVTEIAPTASNDLTEASRLSCSSIGVRITAAAPTGTFTKKIHDQLSDSVRTPPMSRPAAAPTPPTAPQTPRAMFRSRPSRNVVDRIESAAGVMIAPPKPCSARAPISEASDHAKPASSDATVNTPRPTRKIRRRPSRSAARPPSRRNPPKVRA